MKNGTPKKPNINTAPLSIQSFSRVALSVDCVIFGFDENDLKVLLIKCNLPQFQGKWTLLGDLVRLDEDLDAASYRVLRERTGLDNLYLEQVHTFGDVKRHPAGRVITVAYYSLVNIRNIHLGTMDNELHWHSVKSLREKDLAFDHKVILDTCLEQLKKQIQERPVVFNLLESKFSLRSLQNLYEAILGEELDRRNFRKKVAQTGLLIDTREMEENVPHRPGRLYRFNYAKYERLNKNHAVGLFKI